jgi:hypothetical protein
MFGNDTKGDCTIAAIGNLAIAWTFSIGRPAIPSVDELLAIYAILSPDDQGCVMLDVLKYWRQNAIAGVKLGAFAQVNVQNQQEMQVALELFGGLYTGVGLPIAAQTQDIWDVSSGRKSIADSWGGHCVPFGSYAANWDCVTWGALKAATWPWIQEYMQEAYVLITPDWFTSSGKTPEGLDLPTLTSDLALVTA